MKRGLEVVSACFFHLVVLLCGCTSLQAQCPNAKTVWDRVILLREEKKVPPEQQLKELESTMAEWDRGSCGEDSVKALLLQRIGFLHFLTGDWRGAADLTKRSIAVISNHMTSDQVVPGHMVKSYFNLQIIYDSLEWEGPRDAARDSCVSQMIRWRHGLDFGMSLLSRKVEAYYLSGDFFRCLEYCTLAERFMRSTGYAGDDPIRYLIWRVNVLQDMGRIQETEAELNAALAELRSRNERIFRGMIFGLLLRVYADRGDKAMALRIADSSIRFNRASGNLLNCASTLNNLGYYLHFRKLGDLHSALACHQRSLAYTDRVESINTYDWMGVEFSEMGMHDSALHCFQRAFDVLKKGADERMLLTHSVTEFADRDNTEYIANLILDKAAAYFRAYRETGEERDLKAAMNLYRNADLVFEKMRYEHSEEKSRLFWRKYSRSLFAQALEACRISGDAKSAFYFMERSRSALLLDQLNEQALLSPEEIRKRAMIKRHINFIEDQLRYLAPASPDALAYRGQLVQEKMDLEAMKRKRAYGRAGGPGQYADTSGDATSNLRKFLKDDAAIWLELFTTDTAVYVLTVGGRFEKLTKIDGHRFNTLVNDYLFRVSHRFEHAGDLEAFRRPAKALYDMLLGNVSVPFNRVIVSNDGRGIPFESLWFELGSTKPEYLVERAAVSYAFSATYLEGSAPLSAVEKAGDILGLAPINFPVNERLPALVGSDKSLDRILGMFRNGRGLTGNEAVRSTFFQDYPRYRIAQLYTHGVDSSIYDEPLIYMADSAVRLSDMVLQQLPATRLVVLSACWTGTGELHPGEGVFSFGRGFAALGVPSSLTNLWSVENEATYKITESFYRYLAKGSPLDEALRKAKLDFLASEPEERRQPNYWAALVLSGRTEPIPVNRPVGWPIWVTGIAVTAGLLFLIGRRVLRASKT